MPSNQKIALRIGTVEIYPAELIVWKGIRQGLSNRAIAERRGITESTVENTVAVLFQKMGLEWEIDRGTSGRRVLLAGMYPLDDLHEPITLR